MSVCGGKLPYEYALHARARPNGQHDTIRVRREFFGVHATTPYARIDSYGLLAVLADDAGAEIIAVTADTARIRKASGTVQTYRRASLSQAVSVWDLLNECSDQQASDF